MIEVLEHIVKGGGEHNQASIDKGFELLIEEEKQNQGCCGHYVKRNGKEFEHGLLALE